MTTYVFAGPTIAERDVTALLAGARVRPPIRHGDLLALPLQCGDVVAIIDGVFLRTGAIRHKEIMHVLQRGVAVWGASSMGALRAAELHPFGMRGVGSVYKLYANGAIDADDEVAVMHADRDAGYRTMSEALVTVRVAAARARDRGIITTDEAELLVAAGKRLPFRDRSYPLIVSAARRDGLGARAAAAFSEHIATARDDVKREDAEALLRELQNAAEKHGCEPPQQAPHPREAPPRASGMPMTSFLLRWMRSAPTLEVDGTRVSTTDALTACQLFAEDYPGVHYRVVLGELVRSELGPRAARDVAVDDLEQWQRLACKAAAHRGLIPDRPQEVPPALFAWLSETERHGPAEPAIARALVRSFRWAPNVRPIEPIVDALSGSAAWRQACRQAAAARHVNAGLFAHRSSFNPHHISDAKVRDWLRERWATRTLHFAMLDRGFSSGADLRQRATMFLPLDHLRAVAPLHVQPSMTA